MLLGFDIGGTFTDFVLLDEASGRIRVHKVLTTPHDPAEAVLSGVRELLESASAQSSEVSLVIHGTTLVTNAILERKGAKVGLLTTRGFRDILAMGIEQRYDVYDLFLKFPEPLVPRMWRLEVDERIDRDGRVRQGIAPNQVQDLVRRLLDDGVESLAISFLHAYRNPKHERAAAEATRAVRPDLPVSLSSEVMPEVREFERTSTCVANAYVQPLVRGYVERLRLGLMEAGCSGRFFLMQSSGGTTSVETAARFPIRLLESGPAAGALAAAFYGEQVGVRNLLSFDMGGTTAKACLIDDGQPGVASSLEVGRVHRFKRGSGLPVKMPVIDLIEIGAGGGSIASINELGLMVVGPESAGADPGPACYGQGGSRPTVTDANLVLGYLSPDYFLGGRIKLDVAAAEEALAHLAQPLGLSLVDAAWGVHSIVNENMAAAARMHILEKGRDPRRYALMAFGGAGPGHACRLARILHLPSVISPLAAGATSALGFLVAPVSFDFARSYPVLLRDMDWEQLNALYAEMLEVAGQALAEAGVDAGAARVERSVDMRYVGQVHELNVPVPAGNLGLQHLEGLREAFEREYLRLYNHLVPNLPPQALTWRLRASGPRPPVELTGMAAQAGSAPKDVVKGERPIYLPEERGYVGAKVYDRYALRPGDGFQGPAIVEERESTAVIGPGDQVRVDQYLNLVIDVAPASMPLARLTPWA